MLDYEDFLRTNKLTQWGSGNKLSLRFSELNRTENATCQTFIKAIENPDPEIYANSMRCLVNIVVYLLKQQIKTLEKEFLQQGGLRERMTKARIEHRNNKK